MYSNRYIVTFTVIMCVVISFALAGTSSALKDRQLQNKKIDIQKNILNAAGVHVKNNQDVESTYNELVTPMMISLRGEILDASNNSDGNELFSVKDLKTCQAFAYVYPIVGKGLWSTLYGYLSVAPSGKSIIGITFYKHGETPGLGAEIEKICFTKNFIGKELYKNGSFRGIKIAKGKSENEIDYKQNKKHIVDGISGATITCKGVERMLISEPLKYHKFFENQCNIIGDECGNNKNNEK